MIIVSLFLGYGMTVYAGNTDGAAGGTASGATTATAPDGTTATAPDAAATEAVPGEKAEIDAQAAFAEMIAGIIKDPEAKNTESLCVKITRPEGDKDSTYEKSYVISGIAMNSDIRVYLAKYNEKTKAYEDLANTDGSSSWDVAGGNAFSKEIILAKGVNKIKIVAYSTAGEKAAKQESDVQINSFTISLLDKSIKTVIKNTLNDITSEINNLFKKP